MCTECDAENQEDTTGKPQVSRRRLVAGGLAGSVLGSAALLTGTGTAAAAATAAQPTAIPPRSTAALELVLLGTRAGPPIDPYRKGIASALVVDGSTYIIDCGRSAMTQFVENGLKLASIRAMLITHLHADHVADYFNYFLLAGAPPNGIGDQAPNHIDIYGPGPAGGLPPAVGGGQVSNVNPGNPTPGLADLTSSCMDAFAYSFNNFMRDGRLRDPRTLATIEEIAVPDVGASYQYRAPAMMPFTVMEDDKVKVTAILVAHESIFPAFAFRFDTDYGSVTFSGDTTLTPNLPILARETDLLVHEAINVQGADLPPAVISSQLLAHTEVQSVGSVAEAAGARRLVLSHIGDGARDLIDVGQWQRWAQQGYSGPVTVGADGQRFTRAGARGVTR